MRINQQTPQEFPLPQEKLRMSFSDMIQHLEKLKASAPKTVIDQFVKTVYAYIDQQDEIDQAKLLTKSKEVLNPTKNSVDERAVIISDSLKAALNGTQEKEANTPHPTGYNHRGRAA